LGVPQPDHSADGHIGIYSIAISTNKKLTSLNEAKTGFQNIKSHLRKMSHGWKHNKTAAFLESNFHFPVK